MKIKTNADRVSMRIKGYMKNVDENSASIVPHIVVSIIDDVSQDTPVKTGMARSGWNASKYGPDYVRRPDIVSQGEVVNRAISRMGTRANSAFVSNGVPYIGLLDQGSSQQAPAGFVRAAVRRAVMKLGGVRLLQNGSAKKLRR